MTFIFSEDKALKSRLSGITVSDAKSNARPVGVWFGQPDLEIRDQSYPYLTIELVDIMEDTSRTMRGLADLNYVPDGYGVDATSNYTVDMPTPVILDYQITSYARQPIHDRQIIGQMMHTNAPLRFGFIYIPEDNTARRMDFIGFAKRDTVDENSKRIFVNTFSVRVASEVFLDAYYQTAAVTDTNITLNHTVQIDINQPTQ